MIHWYLVGVVATAFFCAGRMMDDGPKRPPGMLAFCVMVSIAWPAFWGGVIVTEVMGWAERDS